LIVRFLEKKVVWSTWIAMLTLTIHDGINIATLVTFGVVHAVDDGFTYGISYWMSVAATVASLTCNVTLCLDFFKTRNFGRNGSGLTEKQRSLVISVMGFLMYLGLGSLMQVDWLPGGSVRELTNVAQADSPTPSRTRTATERSPSSMHSTLLFVLSPVSATETSPATG